MKKAMLIGMLALAAFATSASAVTANLLVNGDFSDGSNGWTAWQTSWGPLSASVIGGQAVVGPGATGSAGYYQVVSVAPGTEVELTGDWNGNAGGAGWIEVMLFNVRLSDGINLADPNAMLNSYLDNATWPDPDDDRVGIHERIINKRDSWGLGTTASGQLQNGLVTGNGGQPPRGNFMGTNKLVAGPDGIVVVCIKGGSGAGDMSVSYDNLVLTPEPAAALLLLAGLPLLRRRRA